jgi:hypothetical protein
MFHRCRGASCFVPSLRGLTVRILGSCKSILWTINVPFYYQLFLIEHIHFQIKKL